MKGRERVIKDLVNWKIEYEEGYDGITRSEIDDFENEVRGLDDAGLEDWWFTNVGEWVASRGLDPEEQYEKLVDGEPVDYGYVEYRYSQPY